MAMDKKPILQVIGLVTHFSVVYRGKKRVVRAVDNVSFEVYGAESLGLIGESGCGKSTLALSVLQVLPSAGRIVKGRILLEGEDLLQKNQQEMTKIRSERISMILQDPMVSLDPVFTIGDQIGESLHYHRGLRGGRLKERVVDLMRLVNIPDPERRMKQWPHQMSGGMRQRIVGAIALSCNPKLIFADEPTTNLDVTTQVQYLHLLNRLKEETGVSLIFITHDLGIVAQMCTSVIVMYAGKIVERAPVMDIYEDPAHPYTKSLLAAAFGLEDLTKKGSIPGEPPNLANLPQGCSFHPRCNRTDEICQLEEPPEVALGECRFVRCWKYASS